MNDTSANVIMDSNLTVIKESKRKNTFISSLLFSRATIFYPSSRLTLDMKRTLIAIAESGGTNQKKPLASIKNNSFGKTFRVDLHVDYLLQPHRDILETLLAYSPTIKLDDNSYNNGGQLTWESVFATIDNGDVSNSQNDGFNSILNRESIVLSMSMYELANRMGIAPTRANYDSIEQKIIQLKTAHLIINELDNSGNIIDKKPLSFIQDYRFYCDKSKFKAHKCGKNKTNHVFIIPDPRLLQAIRGYGYFYRLEQEKMANYNKPAIRSFLKYITTHKRTFLHNKTLTWLINLYLESIASKIDKSFRSNLRKDILACAIQIERDFYLQIYSTDGKSENAKIFNTGAADEAL